MNKDMDLSFEEKELAIIIKKLWQNRAFINQQDIQKLNYYATKGLFE